MNIVWKFLLVYVMGLRKNNQEFLFFFNPNKPISFREWNTDLDVPSDSIINHFIIFGRVSLLMNHPPGRQTHLLRRFHN